MARDFGTTNRYGASSSSQASSDPARTPGKTTLVEQISTGAPEAQPEVSAAQASRRVSGQGGYLYEQHANGAITILAGPHNAGKTYPLGDPVNKAITDEIGAFPPPASAPAPDAPPPVSAEPSKAPSLLAQAESRVASLFGWLSGLIPGTEPAAQGPGDPSGAEPGTCEPETPELSELDELMSQDRLTAEQIARARELIAELPAEQRKPLLLALQDKAAYLNQRDNASSQEGEDGGTCNFTSVAMVLEYLGVSNPDPTRQFEDVLIEKAGSANIKSPETWEKVASELGVTMTYVYSAPTGEGMTISRTQWESVRDQHLGAGAGIVMSLRGHVVRLQGVNEAGLVVDDPYGASTLAVDERVERNGETERYGWEKGGINSDEAGEGDSKGEDLGYPWADVETYRFKYVVAFQR
jgi:hypothetical protein